VASNESSCCQPYAFPEEKADASLSPPGCLFAPSLSYPGVQPATRVLFGTIRYISRKRVAVTNFGRGSCPNTHLDPRPSLYPDLHSSLLLYFRIVGSEILRRCIWEGEPCQFCSQAGGCHESVRQIVRWGSVHELSYIDASIYRQRASNALGGSELFYWEFGCVL
jgi:hypothetical protein